MEKEKRYISWGEIEKLVDKLVKEISINLPHIKNITGIKRGGLIPAVMLSHKLDLPYVYSISPNTLVVDDISDTGATLKDGVGVYTATLFLRSTSEFIPDVYAEYLKGEEWISFPWEVDNAPPIQNYLQK